MVKPEGYRKAMRIMQLAAKFQRPILTLLDTPGAYPGIDAEERGQAEAIATNLREMPGWGAQSSRSASGGRQRRSAGVGGRQPRIHARECGVQRDQPGELRGHHLPGFLEGGAGGIGTAADRAGPAGAGADRWIIPEPEGGAHLDPDLAAEAVRQVLRQALKELGG